MGQEYKNTYSLMLSNNKSFICWVRKEGTCYIQYKNILENFQFPIYVFLDAKEYAFYMI